MCLSASKNSQISEGTRNLLLHFAEWKGRQKLMLKVTSASTTIADDPSTHYAFRGLEVVQFTFAGEAIGDSMQLVC